jgi:hypothetical protein
MYEKYFRFAWNFGNEADVSSSSEYDINKKEDVDSFKIEQTHYVSSLNKYLQSSEVMTFH